MSILGNVTASTSEPGEFHKFQWLVNICSDEIFNTESYLESPTFSFSNSSWCLRMFPKGVSSICDKWISLFLRKKNSQSEEHVSFHFVMTLQGIKLQKQANCHSFNKNEDYCGWNRYVQREEVLQHLAIETKGCSELTIKIRLINFVPYKSNEDVNEDIKIIRQDFKDLLLHDMEHDLILKVQDKEFKVHRNIMRFRCPVFKLMFAHDMLEKNRGVVEIPDCDPLAFKQFLFYVYTGTLETLDESVMLDLYYIADKYDMVYLKKMCCQFIRNSLSVHNVCDVIRFASNHSEKSLFGRGLMYFVDNAKEVVITTEYKSLMKDDPIYANELNLEVIKLKETYKNVSYFFY